MDLKRLFLQSIKSEKAYRLTGSRSTWGSGSGSSGNHITKMKWKDIVLEKAVPFSGEERYLNQLWVSVKEETPKRLPRSDPSYFKTIGMYFLMYALYRIDFVRVLVHI